MHLKCTLMSANASNNFSHLIEGPWRGRDRSQFRPAVAVMMPIDDLKRLIELTAERSKKARSRKATW